MSVMNDMKSKKAPPSCGVFTYFKDLKKPANAGLSIGESEKNLYQGSVAGSV